jgi:hypothetical protein
LILRSDKIRADRSQGYEKWKKCVYGEPGEPGFEGCNYLYLEFFLPVGTPAQRCPKKSLLDIWLGIGTKEKILTSPDSYKMLNDLAKARWDKNRIAPVSEETYERLTNELPKICMRSVTREGEQRGGWDEFARIPTIWCDQ